MQLIIRLDVIKPMVGTTLVGPKTWAINNFWGVRFTSGLDSRLWKATTIFWGQHSKKKKKNNFLGVVCGGSHVIISLSKPF